MNLFSIIGVVVVVLVLLGYFGFRLGSGRSLAASFVSSYSGQRATV